MGDDPFTQTRNAVRAALPAAIAQANRYLDAIDKGSEMTLMPLVSREARATMIAEFLAYAAEQPISLEMSGRPALSQVL